MKTFWGFLLGTFVVAFAIYVGLKQAVGVMAPFFLLTAVGQAHFMMGYVWSVPEYRRWSPKMRLHNLAIFGALGLLLLVLLYPWPVISSNKVWFLVIGAAILHFSRDYKYFYNQIRSGFVDHRRPWEWTLLLAALYFTVLFGLLVQFPEQVKVLFPYPTGDVSGLIVPAFVVSILAAGYALYRFSRSKEWKDWGAVRYGAVGILLPGGATALLPSFSATDLVLFVAFWHIIQWYGYMGLKIDRRSEVRRDGAIEPSPRRGFLDRLYGVWGSNARNFFAMTFVSDALLLAPFFGMIAIGIWPGFDAAVAGSFFWGLQGYAYFSLMHFIFTALLSRYAARNAVLRSQGAHRLAGLG